jgi:pentatricopeptide repeat protein
LRHKVPVEDVLDDGTSSRRLAEYFVVVSSQPRWNVQRSASPPRPKKKKSPAKTELPKTSSEKKAPTSKKEALKISSVGRRWSNGRKSVKNVASEDVEEEREPPGAQTESPSEPIRDDPRGNIHLPGGTPGNEYTFQPMITARYPPTDYPDHGLNPMLVQFCFPHSDVIQPSTIYVLPRIHHFVLTTDKGRKVYGTCLTVHEEYYPSSKDPYPLRRIERVHSDSGELDIEVTMERAGRKVLYIPKVLCLLSTWPYLTAFREYLAQLYRLATTTNLMDTPIERHIINLCGEIPAPPPGAFEIQVPILTSTIRFWAPPAKLPIPYVALPYQILFDCLDVDNVLKVWYALVLEHSVVVVSSQYSILTVCSEILCSLLFPMQWSHLYIPLVPRFLSPMLEAPFPYLCGVIGENWMHARQFVADETMIVDLDANTVTFGARPPQMPPTPPKKWEKLQDALYECAGELFWETRGLVDAHRQLKNHKISRKQFDRVREELGDQRWKEKLQGFDFAFNLAYTPDSPNLLSDTSEEKHQSQSDKAQEAFLRFLVSTLKGYSNFLRTPDSESPESPSSIHKRWSQHRSFDRDGFIASQRPEFQPFVKELCMTQQFDDFITKRLYSPGESDVIFFDQSIDAKRNRSRLKLRKVDTPFLQGARAHKVLNVVTAVAPNSEGLPVPEGSPETQRAYVYKTWPERFDPALFGTARPIPNIITAEFDRQSALVSRLRANRRDNVSDGGAVMRFYGGDFDPSPEVATFTVFFFSYSAVIGREWQDYKRKHAEAALARFEDVNVQFERNAKHAATSSDSNELMANEVEGELLQMSSSLLDCEVCPDVCPEYADKTLKFQEEFLAEFTGTQLVIPPPPLSFDDALAEFEETREVADAQINLAFSVLTTMNLRDLPTDPDAFKSLMGACGRCGDTDRALKLMERMKKEGFVTDGELYSALMNAFAQGGGRFPSLSEDEPGKSRRSSDAYVSFLNKKLNLSEPSRPDSLSASDDADSDVTSVFSSESDGVPQASSSVSEMIYTTLWGARAAVETKLLQKKKKKRKRRHSTQTLPCTIVTDDVRMQIVLGESLLDYLYPDLIIDTSSDSCPQCSKELRDTDIVAGWLPCEFQDYTTECPQCKHRFVPRFSVRCSAPTFEGSQGTSTPLYCELLSPWVLREELENIIHGAEGIDEMLNPEWRSGSDIRATLWWNLIVSFNRYRLPVSFLLQGSFQNRLINPTPDDA